MRQVKFTCDGCDQVEEMNDDNYPEGWVFADVTINMNPGTHISGYHLCKSCQSTLVKEANPKTWPRRLVVPSERVG